jgi:hypothetical protein
MTDRSEEGADESSALDPEFRALSAIISAMTPLSRDAQQRVFSSAATFLGIGVQSRNESSAWSPASRAQKEGAAPLFSDDRTPSPKEFLLAKKPRTDQEKIACLAYYLTHYRELPHFKTLDLSKLNTEAAQLKFSNAAYAAENATRAGLLVPASKGAKQISAVGELYVQALPDRVAAKAVMTDARPRKKKRSSRAATGNGSESED